MDRMACIRESLRITSRGMEAVRKAARPGAKETQLEAAMTAVLEGHEAKWDLITGPRTAGIEGQATERALQAGDAVILDLSVKTGSQWTDVCRTFFLGDPGEEVRQAYAMALEAMQVNAAALRSGVEAQAVYDAVARCFAKHGREGMLRHHTGHGVGEEPFQAPAEVPGSRDVIHAGDVMTVEIGAYQGEDWGLRVEDLYLVGEDSAALLWHEPLAIDDVILEVAP